MRALLAFVILGLLTGCSTTKVLVTNRIAEKPLVAESPLAKQLDRKSTRLNSSHT